MSTKHFNALIDYDDPYVQPLIVDALQSVLPKDSYKLITSSHTSFDNTPLLQIRAYEAIDFEHGIHNSDWFFNAYVIRKALIRKHYLSNTIFSWVTKTVDSGLRNHFKPCIEFELDYAEFLDDALVEAFELREAFERNEGKDSSDREWWILKPGMSDRGQGIRLFSTEEELAAIFEEWEAQNPDSDDENNSSEENDATIGDQDQEEHNVKSQNDDHIMTSHLRHFIAQPYIDPPLLIPSAPFNNRKFHIRTYVVAAGALKVYVYDQMLALFASEAYQPPWATARLHGSDDEANDLLQRMRNVHLTNTCVQRSEQAASSAGETTKVFGDNVYLLSKLPLSASDHRSLRDQINATTSELFQAALAHPTNFQPLPQAFEVFGLDFLVDKDMNAWLLEVNAFPDFAQTGEDLRDVVIRGLWERIMQVVVGPHFLGNDSAPSQNSESLVKVLEVDMRRR